MITIHEDRRNALLDRLRRRQRVLDDLFRDALTVPLPLIPEIEAEVLALETNISFEGSTDGTHGPNLRSRYE